ncbi:MAG: ArsR/SmtB family transcription factor [Beijerinckiaceae bacterium]
MSNALSVATVARLIGDPARANMLTALMGGMALTASELAREAGVSAPTASGHLARLAEGGLGLAVQQGRHRYYRLAGPEVADLLEGLMEVATRHGPTHRIGPREQALRLARVCYDHLAGEVGIRLSDGLVAAGYLEWSDHAFRLTEAGRAFIRDFGIDLEALERQRRPVCRACLDWSMRRPHLGGALGAALFRRMQELGWLRRSEGSRAVRITHPGEIGLRAIWRGEAAVGEAADG